MNTHHFSFAHLTPAGFFIVGVFLLFPFFSYAAAPDLSAGVSLPAGATANTPVTFTSTAINIGDADAASFPSMFQVANESNIPIGSPLPASVSAIPAGGSHQISLVSPYTFTADDTYAIRACADLTSTWASAVAESNEDNNCGPWSAIVVSAGTPPPPPPPPPDPSNLIGNPSLEIDSDVNGVPDFWAAGSWGTNNAAFAYPVAGIDGTRAAKVSITNYTDGDAKWYFDDVPVTPGTAYTVRDSYMSSAESQFTLRYRDAAGNYSYAFLASFPASASWASAAATFTPPSGIVSVTVFHTFSGAGTLTVDGFVMATGTPPPPPPPPPDPSNLIGNPSLEIDSDVNGVPDFWAAGSWGTNNAAFAYPVAGIDGTRAAKVSITNYTDGDAKWYFDDVPVTPGTMYAVSDRYIANAQTQLGLRYKDAAGNYSYAFLASFPASASWASAAATFTPPSGAVAVTMFHVLNSTGSLTVDNFVMAAGAGFPGSDAFDTGYVSLTFDDGWYSQYVHALPLLSQFGMKASFYIITDEMKNTLLQPVVSNPSFETVGLNGLPQDWQQSVSGVNNAVLTYPIAGIDGTRAAKVAITSYVSGEAKWTFNPIAIVNPGDTYEYSDLYMANVPTILTARFTMSSGLIQTVTLGTVPASVDWQVASVLFTPPDGAVAVTVHHALQGAGALTIDDINLFAVEAYMGTLNLQTLQSAGHEVSAHTRTHQDLTILRRATATSEVQGSRSDLLSAGFTPVDTFVYPYGTYNPSVIEIVQNAGFIGARGTNRGFNDKGTPLYELLIQEINPTTTVEEVKSWIDTAIATKTWLILMFHEVDHTGADYSTTPEKLEGMLQYLKDRNASVIAMHQGLLLPRGAAAIPSIAPAIDITPTGEPERTILIPRGTSGGVKTMPRTVLP